MFWQFHKALQSHVNVNAEATADCHNYTALCREHVIALHFKLVPHGHCPPFASVAQFSQHSINAAIMGLA